MMDLITPFIRDVEGVNGHVEAFESYKTYASDDATYADAVTYQEQYASWQYPRFG